MATPFIKVLEPSSDVKKYRYDVPRASQDASVPATFLDAMSIRNTVYVEEQGVSAAREFDRHDSRSVHIVAYASVNDRSQDRTTSDPMNSTATTLPVATIRIVPFPHPPHPVPGSSCFDDNVDADHCEENGAYSCVVEKATSLHDGREVYIKLARLAVLPEFRHFKLGGRMVREALQWLNVNRTFFNPSITQLGDGKLTISTLNDLPSWQGLIGAHAQLRVVKFWESCGFIVDEAMGSWTEERIPHVGVWYRLTFTTEIEEPVVGEGRGRIIGK